MNWAALRKGGFKAHPAVLVAICIIVTFDVAFVCQRASGRWSAEFGGHPDEAAHYVTGLMVRDYTAARLPGEALAYAKDYYAHYPKIGLGVWPPLFYVVQAAWTLPLGASREAVMLLMALLAATTSGLIFNVLRKDVGIPIAAIAAGTWVCLPLVREYYGMMMAEMLTTILIFAATLAWGAFLETGRSRWSLLFGVFAGMAIMTKGTGLALAAMAPLAIALTRHWHFFTRPALWAGVLTAAIIAGPWTWKFRNHGRGGWEQETPAWAWTREALPYYGGTLYHELGLGLAALAAVGLVALALRRVPLARADATAAVRGTWAAGAALILAVVTFQSIIPAGREARHLLPAIPAALMFASAGIVALHRLGRDALKASALPSRNLLISVPLGLFAIAALAGAILPEVRDPAAGMRPIADRLLDEVRPMQNILVASDATGEGMFIAEMARRDGRRPSYTILRASKALATSRWSGRDYRTKFSTNDEVADFLSSAGIAYLILDDSVPPARRTAHHDQLAQLVAQEEDRFVTVLERPMTRAGRIQAGPVRLFRVGRFAGRGPAPAPAGP